MTPVLLLAMLLGSPPLSSGETQSVLHVTVTLAGSNQAPVRVARHALLISDNPATSAPRRVLTRADGTADIPLPPGSYTVESDRAVTFLNKTYQWTQTVEIAAGRNATLELNAQNAEILPLTASSDPAAAAVETDPSFLVGEWQESIIALWSPTSRISGFLVDREGLIATDRNGIGAATSVEVQLSATVKVPGRVLVSDVSPDVAIVWVDPSVLGAREAVPLPCQPAKVPPLDDAEEIVAMGVPLRETMTLIHGQVTALHPRAADTDLRLAFGAAGGPVFNQAGTVVGLTSLPSGAAPNQSRNISITRVGLVCEALSAARQKMPGTAPPAPISLPVESSAPYPTNALDASTRSNAGAVTPVAVSSANFDLFFITPAIVFRAQQRHDWTGGRGGRSPEAEARIGRLMDFGPWSEYFSDVPAVLLVRATPKLVEGFWKRLAREAARTQGAALPAFKAFKNDFVRMRISCGADEVTPLHPFALEHAISDKDVMREGLYVFAADALGPHCGTVTLSLYSEDAPEKADSVTLDAKLVDQIWQDFAPFRASGG